MPTTNAMWVLVPMQVKAFVLNGTEAKRLPLAPIIKPDFTRLRLDGDTIDCDILDHIDLDSPSANDRTVDPLTGNPRTNRNGIYLSWTLPHLYRTGMAASPKQGSNGNPSTDPATRLQQHGIPAPVGFAPGSDADYTAPSYRAVPDRWFVVRFVQHERDPTFKTLLPLPPNIPQTTVFVVESDRLRNVDSTSVDWELECSPYLDLVQQDIHAQTGVSIGIKMPLESWKGEDSQLPAGTKPPLRIQRITLGDTSNMLFADYQPHNANVFSIFDDLHYRPTTFDPLTQLPDCTISYFVYGWHSNWDSDPLWSSSTGQTSQSMTNGERLQKLGLTIDPSTDRWGDLKDTTRGLFLANHGNMNSVRWSQTLPAASSQCLDAIELFAKSTPVAIGSTVLDTLLAFIQAHQTDNAQPGGASALGNFVNVARDVLKLQTLLLQDDDSVDAQLYASDLLQEQNFQRVEGGSTWHFSGSYPSGKAAPGPAGPTPAPNPSSKKAPPTKDQQEALRKINLNQALLDIALREAKQMQWLLFAEWWKYASDDDRSVSKARHKTQVLAIAQRVQKIQAVVKNLHATISQLQAQAVLPCELGKAPSFYRHADPTLLIGGVASGWPSDWMDTVPARFDCVEWVWPVKQTDEPPREWILNLVPNNNFPFQKWDVSRALLSTYVEWGELLLGNSDFKRAELPSKSKGLPLYCADSRDCWNNTQPFFPLFIEWEVQYFHIPFENWSLQYLEGKLLYGIKDGYSIGGMTDDVRILSGRSLLLPQASFSLRNLVLQLFKHTPAETLTRLGFDKATQDDLCNRLRAELPFVSCSLDGFLDHLLTKIHGMHVKPNIRKPTQIPMPHPDASKLGSDIGLTDDLLKFIASETAATPYGSLVDLPELDGHPSPFKPMVHGQFRFKKLNIVDKFGQVVSAIDPSSGRNFVAPCTSQYFSVQPLSEGNNSVANVVIPEASDKNEFVQLPPIINHEARMNSCFVVSDKGTWRPATEWENPIWGWIVLNYPDMSLQVFHADGSFFRELTAGERSASTDVKWKPFKAPGLTGGKNPQLDNFVSLLDSSQNLNDFFNMISDAQDTVPHTPASYADIRSAIVGRPLALVNTGWSIELANPPQVNQSSILTTPPGQNIVDCKFQVQFGDKERAFDGMVGFFDAGIGNRAQLDFSTIFTYYPSSATFTANTTTGVNKPPVTTNLTIDKYPKLQPFYISSLDASDASKYQNTWTNKLHILGMLMDPFLAIHAYSTVLPMASLKLPSWAIDAAVQKMSLFFKLGPLIIPEDVPSAYDSSLALKDGVDIAEFPVPAAPTIPIPISGTAQDWNYLQPYPANPKDSSKQPQYNAFRTAPSTTTTKVALPTAPYTAVEGYLHLAHPIVQPTAPGTSGGGAGS